MKRVLSIILTAVVLLGLAACAANKPEFMDAESYKYASSALKIMESYSDGKTGKTETLEKLEPVLSNLKAVKTSTDLEKLYRDGSVMRIENFIQHANNGEATKNDVESLKKYITR